MLPFSDECGGCHGSFSLMVAWTALQWWRAKLDAQGAENVNGGVTVLMVVDGDGMKHAICGGVAALFPA